MAYLSQEIDILCVPEKTEKLTQGLNNVEEGTGLRCRFTSKEKITEFPALDCDDSSTKKCKCDPNVLQDSPMVSLVWGEDNQIPCSFVNESANNADDLESSLNGFIKRLSWIDRYLALWIFLTMALGVIVGKLSPRVRRAWRGVEFEGVSLPVAIGLWWMMFPILCKVRYELMGKLLQSRLLLKHIGLSLIFNWLIAPLLMVGLAFATLPDLPRHRNGIILVGIARCIAMVLIWNNLAGGNNEFCAILVAVNSVLQIAFYSPLALFYLEVVSHQDNVNIGFWIVAKSVLLFLGLPLGAAVITRFTLRSTLGDKWYNEKFTPYFGPTALIGLLFTIFVMFSLQGENVVDQIEKVVRVSVPLLLYFTITFFSTMAFCRWINIPYPDTVTQCFTASSNNFELAIAVAIASFGIDSPEALAGVVGPLIEVPALIGLVYVALFLHKNLKWSRNTTVLEDTEAKAKPSETELKS